MKGWIKSTGTLLLLMLLARAAVGQDQAKDSLIGAELIFYRAFIPKMKAPLKKVSIYIDGTLVHELKANTIWRKKIFPAAKTLVAIDQAGETTTVLNVQTATRYYFKCEVLIGFWFGKPAFHLVSVDEGEAECEALASRTKK